jgi:hypothetical protein
MKRLQIVRRGGFAGLKAEGTVDIDSLTPDCRSEVLSLFSRKRHRPAPGADRYTYQLTLEDGATSTQIEVSEVDIPTDIARAVEFKI